MILKCTRVFIVKSSFQRWEVIIEHNGFKQGKVVLVSLSSSANVFHVLVDLMKKDVWYVVVLHVGMTNLILALLLDISLSSKLIQSRIRCWTSLNKFALCVNIKLTSWPGSTLFACWQLALYILDLTTTTRFCRYKFATINSLSLFLWEITCMHL